MAGLLLDTHTLIWMISGEGLSPSALPRIAAAQSSNTLYISPITAWEVGVAMSKPRNRPNLLGLPVEAWFPEAVRNTGALVAPVNEEIAIEASRVPSIYGSGDPGDCFLIATAHVHGFSLLTRDEKILSFAHSAPEYLSAISC
jgi:PIN domain nuclease of toxin-antitoxin system